MGQASVKIGPALRLIGWVAVLSGIACSPMSEQVRDASAWTNGGFEVTRSDLPVNWLVYSPATIPTGRYELLFDDADFKEGSQSLKFIVEECSSTGGWLSPGISQEYAATSPATYVISFWIKNEGCDWTVSFGGVDAKTGEYDDVDSTEVPGDAWTRVERRYVLPQRYERLRFQLSIRSPGTLWIDDVRIASLGGGEPLVGPGTGGTGRGC